MVAEFGDKNKCDKIKSSMGQKAKVISNRALIRKFSKRNLS